MLASTKVQVLAIDTLGKMGDAAREWIAPLAKCLEDPPCIRPSSIILGRWPAFFGNTRETPKPASSGQDSRGETQRRGRELLSETSQAVLKSRLKEWKSENWICAPARLHRAAKSFRVPQTDLCCDQRAKSAVASRPPSRYYLKQILMKIRARLRRRHVMLLLQSCLLHSCVPFCFFSGSHV